MNKSVYPADINPIVHARGFLDCQVTALQVLLRKAQEVKTALLKAQYTIVLDLVKSFAKF